MYAHMNGPSKVHSLFRDNWKTLADWGTKFSFGCSYMVELTPGICYIENLWSLTATIVPSVQTVLKKPTCTYSRTVHLPCFVGIGSSQIEIEAYQFLTISWGIWLVRNDKIFRHAASHVQGWSFYLQEGLKAVEIKAKQAKSQRIRTWIEQHC